MDKKQFDKLIEDFNENVDDNHQTIVLSSFLGILSAYHLPDFDHESKERLMNELIEVIEIALEKNLD
ncbi:hypothetical protein BTS2_3378 [Bacillus sp. TS-2]|nr:hypothetical protein BTS2_3378 [Bacillus sp. TS-2]